MRLRLVMLLGLTLPLSACGLPQFGPTHARMVSPEAAAKGNFTLVEGTDYIRDHNSPASRGGFPAAFLKQPRFNTDTIAPGDQLMLNVFENVPEGVFASGGQRVFLMDNLQVLQSGKLFVPYVGQIQASGQSVEALRSRISEALQAQTPDPQVALARVPGSGASVTLLGVVGQQGVMPIEVNTGTLSAMIAKAGGPTEKMEEVMVEVERGKTRGRARLSYIVEDPAQDIALRPGDRITLVKDDQSIIVLGAAGAQARVPVAHHDYRLIDLLGEVGGLNVDFANAKGVFIYRTESTGSGTERQVVIRFDLSEPAGIFAARAFRMRDRDTVYVSEAPIRNAQKIINTITGFTSSADSLASAVGQ